MKRIEFLGDSLAVIRAFPETARKEAGVQLGTTVCVLHAFQKKTQKTGQRHLDFAAARLRQL